jgi:hypothetical protein
MIIRRFVVREQARGDLLGRIINAAAEITGADRFAVIGV